jgi:DNA invertase Pin-like site-specific DNA recombinase
MQIKQCIALYIRLSDDDDNVDGKVKVESNSVTAQRKLLAGFVDQQKEFTDMAVVEYVDDGYSGTNFNRPSFQRMMEDARAGRIGIIVIKDFSRFGRDYLEVGNYLEKILPLLGVRILSVNDGFDSENCSGMTGGMSIALKNMLNAMYSKDLSGKVRTAMATHARNGEYMPSRPKYGYMKDPEDKHHLVIDPEAAEIVRLVFTMAADGKNKGQIARYLNENHVMTCREYLQSKGISITCAIEKEKKLWSQTTIGDMLKNEVYLGKTIWSKKRVGIVGGSKLVNNDRKDWIVVEGTHEPIVSEGLFAKANEMAFTNKKRPYQTRTKSCPILMCPSCGRRLGLTGSGKSYRCLQAHISGLVECSNSKMDKNELEETVLICARNMVHFISENLENKKKEWMQTIMQEEKISTLASEKKRLSSRKMKLYSDYRTGKLTKEKYMDELENTTKRIAEIDQRIPEIENEIEEARKRIEEAGAKQTELNDIAALQSFDKQVLHKIIDKVYVYGGGKIEILWKMDDIFYTGNKSKVIEVNRKKED